MVYDYRDDDDSGPKPPTVLEPTLKFPQNALYVGHINPSTDSYCSAILSDTVGLKGPTTTDYDVTAANSLNSIARVGRLSTLTIELINSRVPPSSTSISDILNLDAKTYELAWKDGSALTLRWTTFESGDPDFILDRQDDFLEEMRKQKEEFSIDFYFMSVVDELKFFSGSQDSYSWLLLPSRDEIIIATQAFGTEARVRDLNQMEVTPLISRTKEFLPPVVDYLREREPFDWGFDHLSIGLATDDL